MKLKIAMWNLLVVILSSWVCFSTASVSYDHKAIVVNGVRRILISGSIHYPRSTPEMWPDLIAKAKAGGLDVIQTYVFWNGHEPKPGEYYFEGRYDLVKFIKIVQQAGLYVHLRIGPYACAEWNFGGFPVWLKYVPGISFRTDNGPFKYAMQKFTTKIVNMMNAEELYETQGGPIIMSQIENEYGPVEYELGAPGEAYTKWAAQMAVGLDTGVPWVMCKQDDAPDPIINACNGFYCDYFSPNKDYKPKMWTENWTGWFTNFGGAVPYRPAEDLAFSVARFILKGGSFINYYMYHGGTNFGRTAGGPFIATSYDYDAPLDEFGLLRQPKWGHLKDLHRAIKLCEPALVSEDPVRTSLGNNQEASVFNSKSGACAAFLANYDKNSFAKVAFNNMHYNLPPWSISILPDCKNTVYNTARISAQSAQMKMTPVGRPLAWQSYNDETTSYADNTFTTVGLLEQINTTRDVSDYLWYMTDVRIDSDEGFLRSGEWPVLTVLSAGHALHVFINDQLTGTVYGSIENPKLTFSSGVNLRAGVNKISLLSIAVGLPNVGTHFETWNAGVLGPVTLYGLNEGRRDLTWQNWSYKVGLNGEALSLHSLGGSSTTEWAEGSLVAQGQPLTWYKTTFDTPDGDQPLALDMNTMGKGQIWINGRSIGRHWPAYKASGTCGGCSYAGWYDEKKCLTNCGEASQRWYHIPRSWLKPTNNLLVVFEELGGVPFGIFLVKRELASVCADIYEWQPTLMNWQMQQSGKVNKPLRLKAHLWCAPGQKITSIKYASFGTLEGACGSFLEGSCHAHKSYDAFERTLNMKKGQSNIKLQELVNGQTRTLRRSEQHSPVVHFHIQLLSLLQKESDSRYLKAICDLLKNALEIRSYLHDHSLMQYGDKLDASGKCLSELLNLDPAELSAQFSMKRGHIARFTNRTSECSENPLPASITLPASRREIQNSNHKRELMSASSKKLQSIRRTPLKSNSIAYGVTTPKSLSDFKLKDDHVFKGIVAAMLEESRGCGCVLSPSIAKNVAPYSTIHNISVQNLTPEYKNGMEHLIRTKSPPMKASELWCHKPAVLLCIRRPGIWR